MAFIQTLKERSAMLLLLGLVVGVAGYEWHTARQAVAIAATAVRARPGHQGILAEGRLGVYPGAEVTLSSELGGKLVKLDVKEQDRVKKGDVIAEIDVKEQLAALREARARVAEAQTDIDYLSGETTRTQTLLGKDAATRAELDKNVHDERSARARRDSLTAGALRLETVVEKARIVAPTDATVTARLVDPGEMVAAGTPIVTLTDLSRVRVEAEVEEFDAARVHLGAKVDVSSEGFDTHWQGEVEQIPDVVVAQHIRPLDPSRPTDTRVLVVKIRLLEPTPLKVGQRVQVEIAR